MRAVGYHSNLPAEHPDSLVDLDLPDPAAPGGHDLLVRVEAVSVNPVDTKVRRNVAPEAGRARILGFDAAGTVVAAGPQASRFKAGDAVYYAGDLTRPGTNSALHLVDERIVGRKPESLDWEAAAALPLTTITAWEALFDRLDIGRPVPGTANMILIVGGAGGVGSIAIQLAARLSGVQVIATASRPETQSWVRALGAHHVVDHRQKLAAEIERLGVGAPAFVFSTTGTGEHLAEIATLIAPQGRFAVIDDPETLDIMPFKRKSVSTHWEFMFTRSMFATADIAAQGKLLDEAAALVDQGRIRTTHAETMGPINAANLRRAHARIESGRAIGKLTLAGWRS